MNEDIVDFVCGGFIGLLAWFFGGLDGFIKVLLSFSVIDYVSGVCAAGFEHKLSSTIGFKGIVKKFMMFSLVGMAHVLDKYFLGDTAALRTAVCLTFVGNEGLSILENAYKLGIPFPQILKDKFEIMIKQDEAKLDERKSKKKSR